MTTQTTTTNPTHGNRRKVAMALAATLALGGIGLGLTSAAWTGSTLFQGAVSAAEFKISATADHIDWADSDADGNIQVQLPEGAFTDLVPGEARTVQVTVMSYSTVPVEVRADEPLITGDFDQAPELTVATPFNDPDAPIILQPEGQVTFEVTVTTPSDWARSNATAQGTASIVIAAEALPAT